MICCVGFLKVDVLCTFVYLARTEGLKPSKTQSQSLLALSIRSRPYVNLVIINLTEITTMQDPLLVC